MASAFANNTQHMNSSDKISNSKAKTNYNYLRLVSKTNKKSTSCYEDYITSSSGNVVLKTKKKIEPDDEQISDQEPKYIPISQLVRASSYELLRSINKGYYLPTSIPKGEINRPPYTYGEKCLQSVDKTMISQNPNTSGDLQDILFNEYLDFGNLTLITNTTFKSNSLAVPDTDDTKITKINEGQPNELQIIDASFGDYIIDPDNILNNFKDCDLSTYLGLENENNILEGSLQGSFNETHIVDYDNPLNFAISHIDEHENIALTGGSGQGAIVSVKVDVYDVDDTVIVVGVNFTFDVAEHEVRVSAINITNGGEGYVVGDDLTLTLILPGGSITIIKTFTLTNTNLYSSTIEKIVQWKKIDNTSVNFPSNKYKKFGSNKPIFFYDYDKCSSD